MIEKLEAFLAIQKEINKISNLKGIEPVEMKISMKISGDIEEEINLNDPLARSMVQYIKKMLITNRNALVREIYSDPDFQKISATSLDIDIDLSGNGSITWRINSEG